METMNNLSYKRGTFQIVGQKALKGDQMCAELLARLGITANYKGFYQVAQAVEFALREPESLLSVTKWLYPEVARRCDTSASCVERNIRTAAKLAWVRNRPSLEALACHALPSPPTASAFVAILISRCRS